MDLSLYKMRCGGKSQRFFSLSNRANLSKPEQLMASLLSRGDSARAALYGCDAETLNRFLDLVSENELTGFVLESIYFLKLDAIIRTLKISHHGAEVDLLTLLTRQAGLEAIKFEKFEKKFVSFLHLTSNLYPHIVWLKGIVTSRTCYSSPEYRLSGDFDCFVDPKYLADFLQTLIENDFRVIAGDTGFCNQLGVGPVATVPDLFLQPAEEFVPSAVCGLYKNRWPLLDVKVNPLDRGLRMVELDRFERDVQAVHWRDIKFSAPDLLDQLIIALTHLEKDRFVGWKQLLDIKLLAEKVNTTPQLWDEFVRRCRVEGVSTACCAGLSLAEERLELEGVKVVIDKLAPRTTSVFRKLFTFSVTPLFYWNTSSLPMLFANAFLSDDSGRKMNVLTKSYCPDSLFLDQYYGEKPRMVALILHWLTLLLPGGVVRRTFGKFIWSRNQFGTDDFIEATKENSAGKIAR